MDTDENPMRKVFGVHHCDRAAMVPTPIPPERVGNPGRNGHGFDRLERSIIQAVNKKVIRNYPIYPRSSMLIIVPPVFWVHNDLRRLTQMARCGLGEKERKYA